MSASWWRTDVPSARPGGGFFPDREPGYGFVDEPTPEVSIGVVREFRGLGFGTRLLEALIEVGRRYALPAMSLSVDPDNPAALCTSGSGLSSSAAWVVRSR